MLDVLENFGTSYDQTLQQWENIDTTNTKKKISLSLESNRQACE